MHDPLTFREYQRLAATTDATVDEDLRSQTIPLLGLAGEVGSLLSEYKKYLRDGDRYHPFKDQVAEEVGDVLWYLANIAGKAGLDLEDIAHENLAKLSERWPSRDVGQPALLSVAMDRYDSGFDPKEQIPAVLRVEFLETMESGRSRLCMTRDGVPLGDPLTDNAHIDDGYRYHDVFHLTNAILLRWSPVSRSLMKVKRKSNARIDEVEDGARAAVTEEAISALVFGYARDYSYFDGVESIDFELLRTIKTMTRPFEVRDRTYREWESAILAGFSVWRQMVKHKGGVFVGDADASSVKYELRVS